MNLSISWDELKNELASKEDILIVRQEIETVRQELKGEIETVKQELKGEIETLKAEVRGELKLLKLMMYFLAFLIILMNKGSIEFVFKILGILK